MFGRRPAFLPGLGLLCLCTLVVYLAEDEAVEHAGDLARELKRPPPVLFIAENEDDWPEQEENEVKEEPSSDEAFKMWITMAVCWSSNTKYHDKNKFPYTKALPMSTQLWMKFTPATVIAQVVYSEDKPTQELLEYKEQLEGYGAKVILVPTGPTECALKAQLVRLLAFDLPFVRDRDVIVTADVDAFIIDGKIARPILKLGKDSRKQFWIYRYELSAQTGYTFMMPFIGGRASAWRRVLGPGDPQGDVEPLRKRFAEKLSFNPDYTWTTDQMIVTRAILESGLCSLPASNKLWKELGLEPKPVDDRDTCWKGSGVYEDCNNKLWSRNILLRYHGGSCKWWHFYPKEREADLKAKFEEIMSGRAESGMISSMVGSAKKMQKDWFGRSLF